MDSSAENHAKRRRLKKTDDDEDSTGPTAMDVEAKAVDEPSADPLTSSSDTAPEHAPAQPASDTRKSTPTAVSSSGGSQKPRGDGGIMSYFHMKSSGPPKPASSSNPKPSVSKVADAPVKPLVSSGAAPGGHPVSVKKASTTAPAVPMDVDSIPTPSVTESSHSEKKTDGTRVHDLNAHDRVWLFMVLLPLLSALSISSIATAPTTADEDADQTGQITTASLKHSLLLTSITVDVLFLRCVDNLRASQIALPTRTWRSLRLDHPRTKTAPARWRHVPTSSLLIAACAYPHPLYHNHNSCSIAICDVASG